MAEMKYKIGDRVIIEESNIEWFSSFKGVEGVISKISFGEDGYDYCVVSNKNRFGVWCKVKCLASEFNKDKIVITHDGKTTTATMYHDDGSKESATARCAPEDTFDFEVGAKLALERLTNKVNPVEVNGFKVGDRVNVNGMNGTLICITLGDMFGVQFDDEKYDGHRCLGVKLKAGSPSTKFNCWWVKPENVTKGEATKFYNGKVVCIDARNNRDLYTAGKIYQFENGVLTADEGTTFGGNKYEMFYNFEDWAKWTSSKFLEIKE